MPRRLVVSPDVRQLLEAAGYVWDEKRDAWVEPRTKRELNPDIAASMTPDQIRHWIAAAAGRPPA